VGQDSRQSPQWTQAEIFSKDGASLFCSIFKPSPFPD
jgi:hypothetical protein